MIRTLSLALFVLVAPLVAYAGGGNLHRVADGKPITLFHDKPSPRGTILMFHGYSGTPKQWEAEAQARHAEGYDVIVAALPGHAFVDKAGQASNARLPKAAEASHYVKFASGMFELANARSGGKVHVVGLSVGGAHALEVGLAQLDRRAADGRPIVRSVVAVSPYLGITPMGPGPIKVDVSETLSNVDHMTFGLLGKALSNVNHPFGSIAAREKTEPQMIGLRSANLGALLAIGRFGDEVMARGKTARVDGRPFYAIVSEKDPTANPVKTAKLAKRIGATLVTVPGDVHNLISPYENPNAASFALVHDTITKALREGDAK
jgi:pimeloyl-ACP methyl ester carboxylesterase